MSERIALSCLIGFFTVMTFILGWTITAYLIAFSQALQRGLNLLAGL